MRGALSRSELWLSIALVPASVVFVTIVHFAVGSFVAGGIAGAVLLGAGETTIARSARDRHTDSDDR